MHHLVWAEKTRKEESENGHKCPLLWVGWIGWMGKSRDGRKVHLVQKVTIIGNGAIRKKHPYKESGAIRKKK